MEFKMSEKGFTTQLEYGVLYVSADSDHGYRPVQLLVSSIAVCSGGVFREVLRKKRINFNDIKINANVKRKETGAKEITDINLHFTIYGTNASEDQIKKSLEVSKRNCSMFQSVKNSIHVTETFSILNN